MSLLLFSIVLACIINSFFYNYRLQSLAFVEVVIEETLQLMISLLIQISAVCRKFRLLSIPQYSALDFQMPVFCVESWD